MYALKNVEFKPLRTDQNTGARFTFLLIVMVYQSNYMKPIRASCHNHCPLSLNEVMVVMPNRAPFGIVFTIEGSTAWSSEDREL